MAVRDDFTAGEVLAAADLNDTFASKLPYSYGTATPSTSVDGFLWYDENDTPPTPKFWDGAAFQALTSGKILQLVRTIYTGSNVTTTSTSYVDVTGMTVTISPSKSDSAVLLIATGLAGPALNAYIDFAITDSSNNTISGGQYQVGTNAGGTTSFQPVMIAYATPATTSATTYKLRFKSQPSGTSTFYGGTFPGQMYALEIGA